jgi:thioredoxin-related protein
VFQVYVEISLKSFTVRKKGRSKIGTRCIIKTNNQEIFQQYTGIFAMESSKIVGCQIFKKGGINSDRLLEFLQKNFKDIRSKIIIKKEKNYKD